MDDGLGVETQQVMQSEHDLEEQAIVIRQAKKFHGLFSNKSVFTGFYEYEVNGMPWVWLQYGEYGLANFYKGHANEENLHALKAGDEITILRENEERILRGSASTQFVVAQITSGNGVVYQSPGFSMPDSIEVPTPQS